jgi:hypothetical protein
MKEIPTLSSLTEIRVITHSLKLVDTAHPGAGFRTLAPCEQFYSKVVQLTPKIDPVFMVVYADLEGFT